MKVKGHVSLEPDGPQATEPDSPGSGTPTRPKRGLRLENAITRRPKTSRGYSAVSQCAPPPRRASGAVPKQGHQRGSHGPTNRPRNPTPPPPHKACG
ncbi:hypothetical protein ECG_08105 [Echinococcus granulosus]|uniref:Uncharacterized protein n=1 Tax=Echinococcus granulosus TaxID=6210 RepID=A0A068WZA5_ECHGR|nr:hypothetical protein ECG_08105 [Echinococcus granulosus]CDS23800.1 hypothetical protein EgrG_002046300 [Echinococcus granulosus]